ncbi:hypothetical protein BHE74_00029899 [Ensete ventricosum]|nr:hypothetical protein GW17_00045249 [Ensete ventricosum]RWW62938.1 hypothetical protein BHE74_00029899 [Ensete ventricosum]
MHRVDMVGNLPGVHWKLAEGIRSLARCIREFTRRRPRLTGRLLGVAKKLAGSLTMTRSMELQPDDGPRASLGIGPGSDDAVRFRWEFARRFAEGIRKLVGNTMGDHQEKTERLTASMSEVTGLAEVRS